jgi:TrbC/VIRB2 pilin
MGEIESLGEEGVSDGFGGYCKCHRNCTVATSVAIIAVAVTGFLMLSGRIDARRGLITIIGCFILFGAPTIARGLRAAAGDGQIAANNLVAQPPPLVVPPAPPKPNVFDPYAGASLQQ